MLLLCVFVGSMKAQETLTVYEGSNENVYVPFRVKNFASHTKSQYVIPAKDLSSMNGGTIYCIMYYTKSTSIPHTTVNKVEVCMKEVDDTSISQFATFDETDKVYEGTLEFTSLGTGGTVLITLDKPYVYKGGNLLIGTSEGLIILNLSTRTATRMTPRRRSRSMARRSTAPPSRAVPVWRATST